MRIIAGRWRSRRIFRPDTEETRPMPDRVREAVFGLLGSHYGTLGELPPLRVADVFAGSGSMGLEALSRGAVSCCFFERNRTALAALGRNLESLQVGPEATVIQGDAWASAIRDASGRAFDLVFLDPPYHDSQDVSRAGPVRRYLARWRREESVATLVILHHSRKAPYGLEVEESWRMMDERRFGTSAITVFVRKAADA